MLFTLVLLLKIPNLHALAALCQSLGITMAIMVSFEIGEIERAFLALLDFVIRATVMAQASGVRPSSVRP